MWRNIYRGDLELSDGPLRQDGLRQHLDDQVTVVQRLPVCRPVLITLHLQHNTHTGLNSSYVSRL